MIKRGQAGDAPKSGAGMRTEGHGQSESGKPNVDPRIQTEIGKHLRAIYDDVISEPVPSKFMDLLEQLERSSGKKG
jgi:hypothetical protein